MMLIKVFAGKLCWSGSSSIFTRSRVINHQCSVVLRSVGSNEVTASMVQSVPVPVPQSQSQSQYRRLTVDRRPAISCRVLLDPDPDYGLQAVSA